ncbi:ABC transporter ATP-binding protein [Ahrensia marina]|uniref:ABC transporter ATP-binding protein n=1 Tax=Ahrensia marina TaxID=1514904 RepID=UPI0035CE9196
MTLQPGTLSLSDVSVEIAGKRLVEAISFDVAPGEMVGLLGPNGSGKSTLLRTIYKVVKPVTGTVLVNGQDVQRRSSAWVAQNVAAVLQDMPADFPLTVRDVVTMGRSAHKAVLEPDTAHDRDLIDAALRLQGLEDLSSRSFRTLSGGERQRALLARALVQQPTILVLDEPTNHLDILFQLSLLEFVRELGITIVAALHDLNLAARFCDRICLMDGGQMAALGTPEDVLTSERVEAVYGVKMLVERHPGTGNVFLLPV